MTRTSSMHEQKQSYRHIFKATGLFGGVQVIQILTILVRGKFIALLLGPTGMGMSSLYLSSTTMISNITGLGLNFSAVRDISLAAETNEKSKMSRTTKVFRRWIWFGGLLGVLITIGFAPFLSKATFGNKEYTWAFVWLSCTLLLNALAKSNLAILQGMRKLRETAKSSVIGSIVGLCISVPLYYFFGMKGIIPAIILAAFTSFAASSYYTNKIELEPILVSYKETLNEGKEMVKLGLIMMICIFFGALVTYIVNAFIRYKGGIADVGLYQAGLSISNQFIGLVFIAMGTDYFPRLSAISTDNLKVREMVNQQAEIVVLIAAPLLIALIVTAPLVIRLLLSPEFYTIADFIRWLALGMMFKAASYSVGYIAFAKGDKKVFFIVEGFVGNIVTLLFNIIAYNYGGLKGLGISFFVSYVIYFIIILIISNKLYSFEFGRPFFRIFIFFLTLCLITFILTITSDNLWVYIGGGITFFLSVIFSLRETDKRIGFKTLIIS